MVTGQGRNSLLVCSLSCRLTLLHSWLHSFGIPLQPTALPRAPPRPSCGGGTKRRAVHRWPCPWRIAAGLAAKRLPVGPAPPCSLSASLARRIHHVVTQTSLTCSVPSARPPRSLHNAKQSWQAGKPLSLQLCIAIESMQEDQLHCQVHHSRLVRAPSRSSISFTRLPPWLQCKALCLQSCQQPCPPLQALSDGWPTTRSASEASWREGRVGLLRGGGCSGMLKRVVPLRRMLLRCLRWQCLRCAAAP